MSRNGEMTRALDAMAAAGLTLDDALDPQREIDFLRAPGIGLKHLRRLQTQARLSGAPALTNSQRVAAARAKLESEGGRRLPTGWLQPAAAHALDALLSAGYGKDKMGVISTALLDAARKIGRRK